MITDLPAKFFISGSDTDVGKTLVSAILALGLKANYWKPVQAGSDPSTDSDWLKSLGVSKKQIVPEKFKLTHPLSPHRAAELDGVEISLDDFSLPAITPPAKHLIVEGAGGLLVPLNKKDLVIDLIVHLNLPLLLVCRSGLGTINHTLLSIEAIRSRKIRLLGVVMNGMENPANREAIEHFGQTKVLAQVPVLEDVSNQSLLNCFKHSFANSAIASSDRSSN